MKRLTKFQKQVVEDLLRGGLIVQDLITRRAKLYTHNGSRFYKVPNTTLGSLEEVLTRTPLFEREITIIRLIPQVKGLEDIPKLYERWDRLTISTRVQKDIKL